MKPGKHIDDLLRMKEADLKKLEIKPVASNSVQVAIFVHAITDPIPENLMYALRKALRPDVEGQRGRFNNISLIS